MSADGSAPTPPSTDPAPIQSGAAAPADRPKAAKTPAWKLALALVFLVGAAAAVYYSYTKTNEEMTPLPKLPKVSRSGMAPGGS